MELEYSVEPTWLQKWKPVLQNWRLLAFVAVLCIPFGWIGYTLFSETVSNGIHQRSGYVEADLKALGNFPFTEVNGSLSEVPKGFRALDGKRVQLRGKMWAGKSSAPAVADFQFVYDITKCCFEGPPRVQERVFVHVPNNAKVYMSADQMEVIGTLHVRPQTDGQGTVTSLYDMELESLKPVRSDTNS